MFDIGFWELTIIAVIGLIVLGPERLPVVARTLGRWVAGAKGYVRGLTSELEREVNVDDLRNSVRRTREKIESETRSGLDSIRDPLGERKTGSPASDACASAPARGDDNRDDTPAGTAGSANPVARAGTERAPGDTGSSGRSDDPRV